MNGIYGGVGPLMITIKYCVRGIQCLKQQEKKTEYFIQLFEFKHVLRGIAVLSVMFVIAVLTSIIFHSMNWGADYMFAMSSKGLPFEFLEGLAAPLDLYYNGTEDIFYSWDYMYTMIIYTQTHR